MNGLDYRLAGETFLILLGSLAVLLLVILSFRRAREVQGLGYTRLTRNVVMARISVFATLIAIIFGVHYLLTRDSWSLYVIAGLLTLSFLATLFIRLPRTNRERTLGEKIRQHAFFAWPWRHKWVFIIAAFVIALFCIFVYGALHDNKYGPDPDQSSTYLNVSAENKNYQ